MLSGYFVRDTTRLQGGIGWSTTPSPAIKKLAAQGNPTRSLLATRGYDEHRGRKGYTPIRRIRCKGGGDGFANGVPRGLVRLVLVKQRARRTHDAGQGRFFLRR